MSDRMASVANSKVFLAGTHRARHPEETWNLISPHLAKFGITRVADITGLDTLGIPVAMAVRPLAKTLSVSQGKGQTYLSAKVSAAMEAIEFWHAEHAYPTVSHSHVPASELDLTYDFADVITAPGLVNAMTPLDWIDAVSMVSGHSVPAPMDLVCFTNPRRELWKAPGLRPSSNGLASGNCRPEAALHALYEIIERDTISLQVLRARPRFLAPDSIEDAACRAMIEQIQGAGASVVVTHLPGRFGVPCFGAQIWSEDFPVATLGWGAHLEPDVAVSRAITEAAQVRLTTISGSRDDLPPIYDHVRRGADEPPKPPTDLVSWAECAVGHSERFTDFQAELTWLCRTVVDGLGAEPLLVDLSTEPEFSVVKVILPRTALDMARVHPAQGHS